MAEQNQNPPVKRMNTISVQTRLVLYVLFIALIPLIFIAVRDILQTRLSLSNSAEVSLKASAELTALSLDTFIKSTADSIRIEAQFSDFAEYLALTEAERSGSAEQRRVKDLLTKLKGKDPANILSYAIVDAKGRILLDTAESNVNKNESGDAYFSHAHFSEETVITPVTYLNPGTTAFIFANRILDNQGSFLGVLRVIYRAKVLQELVVKNTGTSNDALIILLDNLKIRMADNRNPSLILKSIYPLTEADYLLAVDSKRFLNIPREEQTTNFLDFAYAVDSAADKQLFRVDITPNIPGDDTIAAAFLKTQPWIVTYSRPTSNFLADVQTQTRTNGILVIITSVLVTLIAAFLARSFTRPLIALTKTADSISQGDLSARAVVSTSDEIGLLASAFNSMTDQLQTTLAGLEDRILVRTEDLQKSNLELETIAEVAREIATIRDLDTLLNVSVNLIRERLNYYHVGIFLVDDRNEFAHLKAASSIAAEQMLSSNIKFQINGIDPLAVALRGGNAYFSPDLRKDPYLTPNPLLPNTVGEVILPLRIRNITIAALDIQASNSTSLGEREISTLKLLADQLAAAVENAQLVRQVDVTVRELTNTTRSQTQQTWKAIIDQKERPGFEYDGLQIKEIPQNLPPYLLELLKGGKPIIVNQDATDKNSLLVPLTILNQVIGVLGLENDDPNHAWTDDDIAIAQAAANRAALTLENARLLTDSQRRANKERTISDATARIGTALSMENILQTTAEELERILGDSELILQFQSENLSKPEN